VFLLALTIMLVDERRETVGVLRLIGLPVGRILSQVLIEGVLIAAAGAAFGLVLSLASEGLINAFFQWRYDTALVFVRITPHVAALCVAIAVPLGAAATVTASWALLRRSGLRLAADERVRLRLAQPRAAAGARRARHSRRRRGRRAAARHAAAVGRARRDRCATCSTGRASTSASRPATTCRARARASPRRAGRRRARSPRCHRCAVITWPECAADRGGREGDLRGATDRARGARLVHRRTAAAARTGAAVDDRAGATSAAAARR
jgi:hypothetical protein